MTTVRASTLDAADLAARLRVSVWRLARRMRRASDAGVPPTLHAALYTIEHRGPVTAGQLAAHEQVTKPTITRTVAMLLGQGLITRTPDPLDGRVTWLTITPAGTKLLHRARRRTDEYLAKRVKALDPDDRDTLERAAQILERLAEPGP